MLLILLSELWPGSGAKNPAAEAGPDTAAYQAQLEQRLAKLIAQVEGAGKTTVMITLETGEERIMPWIHSRDRPSRSRPMCC